MAASSDARRRRGGPPEDAPAPLPGTPLDGAGSATAPDAAIVPAVPPASERAAPRAAAPRETWWRSVAIAAVLAAAGIAVRTWRLADPPSVVFDEVHFGGHAAMYINRTFFFDIHPPLGKMLFAAAAYTAGFDGRFAFSTIGTAFPPGVPYVAMRAVSAVAGGLLVPVAFATLRNAGIGPLGALVAAVLLLADTALAVQSRLILLDATLLLAIALATCAWARFRWAPGGGGWRRWAALLATGVCLGLAASVKWVGLFVVAFVGLGTVYDLWALLGDRRVTARTFSGHLAVRAVCLIAVPVAIYAALFTVHLRILHLSGSGDGFLPPPLLDALRADSPSGPRIPADVVYGSEIMLRHRPEAKAPLMLHSHALRYPEGSQQQQVTASLFRDANSWWIVRPHLLGAAAAAATDAAVPVPRKSIVRLQHRLTQMYLRASAAHRAPLSADLYEVAAVATNTTPGAPIDASTLWILEVVDELVPDVGTPGGVHAWSSVLQLRHERTGCVLVSHTGALLPAWGVGQQEVGCRPPNTATAGAIGAAATASPDASAGQWLIENHVNRRAAPDAPVARRARVSLAQQLWDFQVLMWTSNEALVASHPYQSAPATWPWLVQGMGYWVQDHAQIYFVGNPAVWLPGLAAIAGFVATDVGVRLLEQRGLPVRAIPEVPRAEAAGWFLVGAWAAHYLPFFFTKRSLFVHHYLPAMYFSVLLTGVVFDALTRRWPRHLAAGAAGAAVLPALTYFYRYWPLIVGDPVDAALCTALAWRESWRLLC